MSSIQRSSIQRSIAERKVSSVGFSQLRSMAREIGSEGTDEIREIFLRSDQLKDRTN